MDWMGLDFFTNLQYFILIKSLQGSDFIALNISRGFHVFM